MSAPFRLGLIGAGRMGRTHLRALEGSDLVTIAAIAEPSAQAREALGGTGASVHASVAEMLERSAPDGVLIAAPSDLHDQLIAEVAAAGLPILCEKPCGVTSAQASAAAKTAASAGVPLQIAYWRRYVPALQSLRERMAAGDLGDIHLVSCYQWDESPPAAAFRAHSGGIFIDMGVHEFDQLRWLTGQQIGAIQAVAAGVLSDPEVTGDVDSAELIAQLSGGTIGLVSLGRHHPPGDLCRAEVFGTRGAERHDFIDPAEGDRAQLEALRRQAEDFTVLAGGGTSTGATAADAVAALDAAERASAAIPALAGKP
jgi:myo-inositol 2-dehydrogenase / D-chiro-inositol 1-dehydrogenase